MYALHAVLHHVLHIQKVVANQTDKGYNFTNTVENYAYTKYQQVTYNCMKYMKEKFWKKNKISQQISVYYNYTNFDFTYLCHFLKHFFLRTFYSKILSTSIYTVSTAYTPGLLYII